MKQRWWSGERRMTLGTVAGVTLPFALTVTLLSVVTMRADSPVRAAQFREAASATSDRIARVIAQSARDADASTTRQTLEDFLQHDPALLRAEVLDVTGETLLEVSSGRTHPAAVVVTSDLRHGGEAVGTLRTTFDPSSLEAVERAVWRSALWGILAAVLIGAVIALGVGRVYRRTYRRVLDRVRGTAGSLDEAMARLQGASTSQSAFSAQSASAIAETQAVASEVGGAAAAGVERAAVLADLGGKTDEEAAHAIAAVEEARDALDAVGEQTTAIGVAIGSFSEKAAQIGEIATTVSGLSDRSNLLALNAAIEASRAGENGKAFSVVSREMRKLAEATHRSAATVKQLVSEVQDEVAGWTRGATDGGRQVGGALQRAVSAVRALRTFAGSTRALSEISRGLSATGTEQRGAIDSTVEAMKQATAAGADQLDGVRSIESTAGALRALSGRLLSTLEGRQQGPALRRRRGRSSPLSRRLLRRTVLTTAVAFAVITFGIGGLIMALGVTRTMNDPRAQLRATADGLAIALREPTARMDRATVRALLASADTAAPLLHAQVVRPDGAIVAAVGTEATLDTGRVERAQRALKTRDGRPLGTLHLTHSLEEAQAAQLRANVRVLGITLFSVLIAAGMAFLVARRFEGVFEPVLDRAREASAELDALVGSLAAAAAQQSSSMAEAAAALQETHASAAEVRKGAAAASERAGSLLSGGAAAEMESGEVSAAIAALREAVEAAGGHGKVLAGAIASFSARAQAIADVATTVALLAERSDLLAVNASIESARGGTSATSGFMVVAEEIRSLADGSARAANQVKNIVDAVRAALARAQLDAEELQRRLDVAAAATRKAQDGVARFADVTRQFIRLGNDLSVSAAQQENAVDQMAGAVAEAADGARAQAESTREVETVAQGLVALSRSLVELTGGPGGAGPVRGLAAGAGAGAVRVGADRKEAA